MAIQSEKFGFEVKDNTTGLPLSGATVELREGSNVYTLTELGTSAYYVIASIPTGKYDVYVNSVATGQSFGVGVGQIAALGNTSNNVPVSTASAYDFQNPTELKTTLNLENVTNVAVPVPSVSDANKVIQVDSNGDYELATVSAAGFNTVFEVTKASELIAALSAEFREKTIIMSEGSFFFNSSQTFEVYGACNIYAGDGLQGVIFGNNVGQTITFNAAAGTTPNVGLYFYTSKLQFDSSLSGELTYVFNVPVYSRTLNFLDQIDCFISGTGTIYYEKLNSSIPGGVSITVTEFVWDATASGSIPNSAQDGSFVLKNADGSILITDNVLAPSFRWDSTNGEFLIDGVPTRVGGNLIIDETALISIETTGGTQIGAIYENGTNVIFQGTNGGGLQFTAASDINFQTPTNFNSSVDFAGVSVDATGATLSVGTPTSGLHAANKTYVDNAVIGSVQYQGSWNAASNTPTLTSGAGTQGHYYIVSVEGTTNLDGITDWKVGDWAIFNGTTWDKIDNTDFVKSVTNIGGGAEVWAQVTGAGDAQFRTIANGSLISFSTGASTIDVDDSRVVSTDTAQTITGAKTINNDLEVNEILAVGLTNSSEASLGQNLSMGATASYSWLQSWNSRPLRINGLGNAIEIGSLTRFFTFNNSSPSNGDIWFDGTNLKGREGGATFNLNGAGGSISEGTPIVGGVANRVITTDGSTNLETNSSPAVSDLALKSTANTFSLAQTFNQGLKLTGFASTPTTNGQIVMNTSNDILAYYLSDLRRMYSTLATIQTETNLDNYKFGISITSNSIALTNAPSGITANSYHIVRVDTYEATSSVKIMEFYDVQANRKWFRSCYLSAWSSWVEVGAGGATKLKYQSTTNIANISGGSALSGSYFATKIIPEADIDVDKFEYYVTSASTGKTVYCGIYSSDGATLLGEASGNTDAVGERTTGSIGGGPVSLTGGTTYWLSVLEGSGAPNLGSKTAFADANLNRSAFVSGSPTGMPTSITGGSATTTAFYIGVLA